MVRGKGSVAIGREANRWEERFFLFDDPDAEVVYGQPDEQAERERAEIVEAIRRRGVRRVARESGLSVGLVSGIAQGKRKLTGRAMARLAGFLPNVLKPPSQTRRPDTLHPTSPPIRLWRRRIVSGLQSSQTSPQGFMSDVVDSQDPLGQKVSAWLIKQGYPLEMEVASVLREEKFWVRQSTHYLDSESSKSREIDAIATDLEPTGMLQIHFVVECKSGDKPWLLLTSQHTLDNYNRLFALGVTSEDARRALVDKLEHLDAALPWYRKDGRVGYNLTQAFTSGTDDAFKAAVGALKACLYLLQPGGSFTGPFRFAFPAIVVESPLFECFLDDSGDIHLTQIEQGWFFFNFRLPAFAGTCVRVVSKSALKNYCAEARSVTDSLRTLLAPDVERQRQQLRSKTNNKS